MNKVTEQMTIDTIKKVLEAMKANQETIKGMMGMMDILKDMIESNVQQIDQLNTIVRFNNEKIVEMLEAKEAK